MPLNDGNPQTIYYFAQEGRREIILSTYLLKKAKSLSEFLMIFRQPIPVRFNQVVYQIPNLIQIEFGGSVGVEHSGVVDMFPLAGERCFHGHCLYIDVGLH